MKTKKKKKFWEEKASRSSIHVPTEKLGKHPDWGKWHSTHTL